MQQESAIKTITSNVVELPNTSNKSNLKPNILLDTTMDKEMMEIEKDKESLDTNESRNKSLTDLFSGTKLLIWIPNVFLNIVT